MAMSAAHDRAPRGASKKLTLDAYLGMRRQHREPVLARFVGSLRLLLPLLALVILMAALIWPLIYDSATGFRLNSAQLGADRTVYSTMDNPRFAGIDKNERPYVVTADKSEQIAKNDKIYDLSAPKGDILDEQGHWIYAQGDTGRLYQTARQLDVAGNVILYHDKGNRMEGERARIDLLSGDIASDRTVHGYGPGGTVVADGVHVTRRGRLIQFTGRSHMIVDNQKDNDDTPARPAAAEKAGEPQ